MLLPVNQKDDGLCQHRQADAGRQRDEEGEADDRFHRAHQAFPVFNRPGGGDNRQGADAEGQGDIGNQIDVGHGGAPSANQPAEDILGAAGGKPGLIHAAQHIAVLLQNGFQAPLQGGHVDQIGQLGGQGSHGHRDGDAHQLPENRPAGIRDRRCRQLLFGDAGAESMMADHHVHQGEKGARRHAQHSARRDEGQAQLPCMGGGGGHCTEHRLALRILPLPPPQSADGQPQAQNQLTQCLNHLRDGGGRHVPHALVQAPVGRHHTAEEDRRGHHHHGPEAAGNAHKAGVHKRRAQHDQRPDRAGDEKHLAGHPVYHLHIPVPAQRHARGHHAGHRDGKTGNGNGIYRQINIVSGGKIAEPGDARDFLPLDGNFEQGADDFGQHRRQGQDDGPLLETLPFIFRQALLPFPPSIRQTAAASARISAQKASAAAPALSLTSSSLTTPPGVIPAARLVMQEIPSTSMPHCAAAKTSGTVDMPTASPPSRRMARISAGVSNCGPAI